MNGSGVGDGGETGGAKGKGKGREGKATTSL